MVSGSSTRQTMVFGSSAWEPKELTRSAKKWRKIGREQPWTRAPSVPAAMRRQSRQSAKRNRSCRPAAGVGGWGLSSLREGLAGACRRWGRSRKLRWPVGPRRGDWEVEGRWKELHGEEGRDEEEMRGRTCRGAGRARRGPHDRWRRPGRAGRWCQWSHETGRT